MSKIVVFGATGFTGRLTTEALLAAGAAPVLAARDATALAKLATELGGADTAVADVREPTSVRALLGRGDVLVTTVGPFLRYGRPALDAALAAGAHYLDSTGEGPFIRTVFEHHERARDSGIALLPAFGFDYVPGNLAAALALREAPDAVRADIGYFLDRPGTSGGTRASIAGMLFEEGFALRGGRVVAQRSGSRVRAFDVAGGKRSSVSIPGSEHLVLHRAHPGLREADVYLGLPEVAARGMQVTSLVASAAAGVAPVKRLALGALGRVVKGSTGGPGPRARARTRSHTVADVSDADGRLLASVTLTGGDPYDLTAAMLSWGARTALDGGLRETGALGPVEAFGLDALIAAAAAAGLTRSEAGAR
ncbi:saccharopine dehydrogenase family protein [Nocardia bovistercoris]|uniref:Saccharopine dehydrogenase NADP-binding domain-containing protein n=1 Tax=Nocardia bovistercoris TaxID=2785916 RepID=A0A931ID29_9NOCA|nr:saccharopine dehydrogenase NADP-binding domain-containing protein [Nocardia bovistercoris]MBH0779214.1 saccharopine dehydrogenase NADP-binding domain-containing protein [Nocardia bovistercoris]